MYIDYKCTIWKRVHYPSGTTVDDIKNLIGDRKPTAVNVDDLFIDNSEVEDLYDTMEELTLIDNDNNSTIEIYDENGKEIWNNCNGFSDDEI